MPNRHRMVKLPIRNEDIHDADPPRVYSVAIWLTVSVSSSWKKSRVRALDHEQDGEPPTGIGR